MDQAGAESGQRPLIRPKIADGGDAEVAVPLRRSQQSNPTHYGLENLHGA